MQTGSRARDRRVDDFSDLDIELLGPRPFDLARDPSWIRSFGEPMVTLALENEGPGDLGWPTSTRTGTSYYTWHIGHHMDEWLPEREFEAVQQVFTRFEADDTMRGVSASMDHFADVSARVASRLDLRASWGCRSCI